MSESVLLLKLNRPKAMYQVKPRPVCSSPWVDRSSLHRWPCEALNNLPQSIADRICQPTNGRIKVLAIDHLMVFSNVPYNPEMHSNRCASRLGNSQIGQMDRNCLKHHAALQLVMACFSGDEVDVGNKFLLLRKVTRTPSKQYILFVSWPASHEI